ncbi:MAG: hypothetical protein WBF42_11420 [Terracidiphilus sp.]
MRVSLPHLCLTASFFVLTLSAPAFAQQHPEMAPQSFTGVAMGTGGSVGGRSVPFDFRITSYTTDQELQGYADLLKDKGQGPLVSVLQKQDRGRIQPVGSVGNQIAVARRHQEGPNTIITIVTARQMSMGELRNNGRSVNYPFSYLRVTLDAEGKGTGQFILAAKVRFDQKSGKYELESFGNQYMKAANVRPNN